ncbi:MAG TPA: MFS transporter [Planctomycetaceae bacterium]|nr:MFS transporter [Planctomycetaceae bacterium]
MSDMSSRKFFVAFQLSVMMFLQFFIWGAWYVTAPNFLSTIGFTGDDFGWTYAVGPIAGMITPLLVGMVADRYFSAQRILGILHLLGGAIMFGATMLMQVDSPIPDYINVVFLGYMLTYYPTLALTNTIALKNMTDPEKQFPIIRVFGTLGWIAAGFAVSWANLETNIGMFQLTAAAAFALGVFSFLLPDTPPNPDKDVSISQLFGMDALKLLKDRSYLVFMISSVLICIPLAFYYQITSRVVEMVDLPIGQTMSYGQISEVVFMLIMPFFFARLGVKWMLFVGMAAWVTRYALFSLGASSEQQMMILGGIVLHGICYDFFFVTGQIYTDGKAPVAIRAQAQGLLVMLTLGLGMLIGARVAGKVETYFTPPESLAFAKQVEETGGEIKVLTKQSDQATGQAKSDLEAQIATLEAKKKDLRIKELKAIEWKPLWGIPAIFAAVIMVLFGLFFHDRLSPDQIAKEENKMLESSSVPLE